MRSPWKRTRSSQSLPSWLWQPIDSLFVRLHNQMTTPTAQSPYESITVQYDEQLGYPTSIVYREKPTVADASAEISVRNVVPF